MALKLKEMQKSALGEAGNIGSGHAAIALAQMMGRKIMIAVPSVDVLDYEQTANLFPDKEEVLSFVSLKVLGEATGALVFILKEKMALGLCDILMGQASGTTVNLGDIERSALKEVVNIIGSSYLTALSEMTGIHALVTTPDYHQGAIKIFGEVLGGRDIDVEHVTDFLCIKTEIGFTISNPKVKTQSSEVISFTSKANPLSIGIPFSI